MSRIIVSAPYMMPVIDRYLPMFHQHGCDVIVADVQERLEEHHLLPLIGEAEGIVCGDDRLTRRVLREAPKLKVISKWGTGIDSIDRSAAAELGIRVCNTPGAFTIPVADTVFASMLCMTRRIVEQAELLRRGGWEKLPGVTLSELTLGIVGLGAIGSEVAKRAACFGMTVLAYDPQYPQGRDGVPAQMRSLEEVLSACDVLTLHCDLNDSSQHLLCTDRLNLMKPGSMVINTSRGPVVKEEDLIAALKNGTIGGAALDVFEHEPLPESSPLRKMPNVLLSAHNSNSSPRAWERVHESTLKNLFAGLREVKR